jgi:hypothetical protein
MILYCEASRLFHAFVSLEEAVFYFGRLYEVDLSGLALSISLHPCIPRASLFYEAAAAEDMGRELISYSLPIRLPPSLH